MVQTGRLKPKRVGAYNVICLEHNVYRLSQAERMSRFGNIHTVQTGRLKPIRVGAYNVIYLEHNV